MQSTPQLVDAAIVMAKRMAQVIDNGYQHQVQAGAASDFEKHWRGARFERAVADWSRFEWTGRDRLGANDVGPLECRASYKVVEFWWILHKQLETKADKDYVFGVVPSNSRVVKFVGWVPGSFVLEHPEWQVPRITSRTSVSLDPRGRAGHWNVPHAELFNLDSLRRKHGAQTEEDMFSGNPLAW